MDDPEHGGERRMSDGQAPVGGIDVDRLMADLKSRVAARRAAGELDPGVLDLPFRPGSDEEPAGRLTRPVVLRPQVAYSTKPGIGPLITRVKRTLISLLYHFLNDVVDQINGVTRQLGEALSAEERAREGLEVRADRLESELDGLRTRIARLETDTRRPPAQ
jgi:hypothetical protein